MPNISLSGKAIDGDPDRYWINLFAADSTWQSGEPGNATNVSTTKQGKWLSKPIPDKGVYANDTAGKVMFFFRNLDPSTVKMGDRGQGHAYETARAIDWHVDSL
ncbi:hypothetical protein I6F33_34580 [Bradyrhizobium sp. BRP20]|uniref:hypothetical protein n=1 Tax=Bradyrhizobium sp. BRP20 TaxID=2793822 RepID=UPI001CD3B903|nr:hypothetical protein [Bradyrhizobium sp. BRP20]MCA1438042.1 hypothetical protein [Bradyrhizobium sp. BRP20]